MKTLAEILEKLKVHPDVDGAFITGSQSIEAHKPYSDIDLVVILTKHAHDLTSIYAWIEGKFADIFFFDHADLERIELNAELPGNGMDAVFVSWLQKGSIQFDKSHKLKGLKDKSEELQLKVSIPEAEKQQFWNKVNYNLVANKRYFESNDPLYHEALELRLLYSVPEVFTAYFEFRDILWRGEKNAMKYLKENDVDFYDAFMAYANAFGLQEKFEKYSKLVELAFTPEYPVWDQDGIYPQSKDRAKADKDALVSYWNSITS